MAERTYNTGRVVGWSAYEEFLKEHPNIDPSVVTEQIYTNAVTFGVTRTINLPLSNWSGTNILTKTVSVPGAVWGVIPIAGIQFDGLSALTDTAAAAAAKDKALKAAENIFACYCSDSQGNKLANSTSQSGYITFCAHPDVTTYGLTSLPLIIRGLGLEGLSDGHAYFGPEGLLDNTGAGGAVNPITDHKLTTFKLPGKPDAWAQWFGIKFEAGQRWIAGLSFMDNDAEILDPSEAFPHMHNLSGTATDTTTGANSVPITLVAREGDLTTTSLSYNGYFSWMDLTRMMVTNEKAHIKFEIQKFDSGNPTYVDITRLFGTKLWNPDTQSYQTRSAIIPFQLGYGSNYAYPVLEPWDTQSTPSPSSFDGFYRVVLKLYPSPLGTTSKFEMLILGYLKSAVTLTSASEGFLGTGCWWRGNISTDCYNDVSSRYPNLNRENMTLIMNTMNNLSGNFQPSNAQTVYWDTVPESADTHWGRLDYLMRRSFEVTQNTNSWQVNFAIKGSPLVGTSNNDRLYGIDTSCSDGAVTSTTGLTTYVGGMRAAGTYTWTAATTMDPNIEDFDPSHASFQQTLSGIYTTV